jgi:Secretion system C-terminal sorting domain
MNIRALVIAGLLLGATSFTARSQTITIARSVIGSGMTPATNGTFSVDGTIGQPVIGPVTQGPFTAYQGFWYTLPQGSSSVKEGPADAAGFSLDQNYPNPFNPSTTIKYSVAEQTRVTIRVMNLLGQEVHTPLVDEVDQPGTYQIDFTDADNLPSGTYIYRMDAGSFSASKRMVLLK